MRHRLALPFGWVLYVTYRPKACVERPVAVALGIALIALARGVLA